MNKKSLDEGLYKKAKDFGYLDSEIAAISKVGIEELEKYDYPAAFRIVDTCAGEFHASTPYFYSTYGEACELEEFKTEHKEGGQNKENILVLGSGPIRIGQGIEFDYCSVHAARAILENGYESVMVNSNPRDPFN